MLRWLNPQESTSGTPNQIIMDLGDVVPEEYTLRFGINGHRYEVHYQEARVDEVLPWLLEAAKQDGLEHQITARRALVTKLMARNLVEGDPTVLEADLCLLPYTSFRGQLDILTLYQQIHARVKKNDLGETMIPRPKGLRGLLANLRSSFTPAKGA